MNSLLCLSKCKVPCMTSLRAGSRIPRRRRCLPLRGASIECCKNFPKPAWNWENYGPWGGGTYRGTRFRSATDCCGPREFVEGATTPGDANHILLSGVSVHVGTHHMHDGIGHNVGAIPGPLLWTYPWAPSFFGDNGSNALVQRIQSNNSSILKYFVLHLFCSK